MGEALKYMKKQIADRNTAFRTDHAVTQDDSATRAIIGINMDDLRTAVPCCDPKNLYSLRPLPASRGRSVARKALVQNAVHQLGETVAASEAAPNAVLTHKLVAAFRTKHIRAIRPNEKWAELFRN